MNEIMGERHKHRNLHIYPLILTVRDEVHYTEIFLAIKGKQSIVKPRSCRPHLSYMLFSKTINEFEYFSYYWAN